MSTMVYKAVKAPDGFPYPEFTYFAPVRAEFYIPSPAELERGTALSMESISVLDVRFEEEKRTPEEVKVSIILLPNKFSLAKQELTIFESVIWDPIYASRYKEHFLRLWLEAMGRARKFAV